MSFDIAEALQRARYNELVHIEVTSDDGKSREIILAARLDKENGGVQWNTITSDNDDGDYSIALEHHLSTKRWFFPMLNDRVRNELYEQAIKEASQEVVGKLQQTSVYGLDIGSGTGLLAMLVAKHLDQNLNTKKKNVKITSLEMSSAMAKLAHLTVKDNFMHHNVQIKEIHSCEMEPLQPKAHMCTSELLESGLLAEGWLPAMRDAWERHLSENAVVLPQRARVYAQIIEGNSLSQYWGPHNAISGFLNDRILRLWCSSSKRGGGDEVLLGRDDGIQIPIHAKQLLADKENEIKLLSDPIEILDINVSSKEAIPSSDGQSRSKEFVAKDSGRAQAVLFWWELDLYGDKLTYSTHHKHKFQDHWHQCIFIFTKAKEECTALIKGELATLKGSHDDSRIYFDVIESSQRGSDLSQNSPKRFKPTISTTEFHCLISPVRAWQLNDLIRINTIRNGISFALQEQGLQKSVVLDLSDFSLCAIMAALLGANQVISVESSSGSLPMMAARIAQLSNELPLDKEDPNSFQILRCHPEQLSKELLGGSEPNIIVAEPYYEVLEGWHLQEALNYFYILRALKERGIVSGQARSVPAAASVMVCAFESTDLGQAYRHCDKNLCGFEHEVINSTAALYDRDILIPAWQYDMKYMTEPMEVAQLDYEAGAIIQKDEATSLPFIASGSCHGMIMWIDYKLTVKKDKSRTRTHSIISTTGRAHHQVIRMLPKYVNIKSSDSNYFFCQISLKTDNDYDFAFGVRNG